MSFFELFNGTPVDSLDDDHRIAFNKPAIKGSKNVTWVNFRTILSGFFMNLTGNQTVNGDKTFTGRIVGRTPLSDSELATKKYVDDNAGGGEEIIEVDTYVNLPAIGVNSVLYIVLDENVQYRWTGSAYIKMSNPLSYATEAEALAGTDNTKVMTSLRVNEQWNHNVVNEIVDDLDTTDKTLQGGINELAARKEVIYASQAEAVEAVETEKTMNPLRVGQHWSYAIANNIIGALNTSNKKIVGAINELKTAWDNVLIALDLKAMQNVGVCQKIPIYPEDLIIDPVALTFTIATVNRGQAITANNPIRVFTDGSGVIKKWEKYTPQTVSFTKTLGSWGVYFDNTGTLKCDQTVWADFATIAPIARFYINDQLANASMIEPNVWEAHLNDVSATAHKVMHFTTGTENISGFDIVSNVLTPDANGRPTVAPNANGRNTVVSLTGGENSDDGLFYTVVNSTNNLPFNQDLGHLTSSTLTALNSGLFRVRKNDSSGRLAFNPATRFPFAWNSSNNRPQYVTELGVFTDVPDNRWIVNFIYSFQDWVAGRAVKVVSAHVAFATYNEALAYGWESIRNLYPTMRDQEIRQLYKLIHYVDHSGGGSYPAGCKYAGLVSITDIRKSVQASVTATGGATLASNVLLTPPTGYTSNNVQLGVEELAANTLKGNTTVHTTPIAADSIGILDSVAGLFKRIPLSSIKTFVLNGLTTTQVSNVSNVYGATVTDVLNAAPATQVDTVEDTDLIAGQRPSQFNMTVPWSVLRVKLRDTIFVSSAEELSAALALERSTVRIYVTAPITGVSFANSYPSIIYIAGESLTVNNLMSLNQLNGTGAKFFIENRVIISGSDCIILSTQTATMYFRHIVPESILQVSGAGGAVLTVNCDNAPPIVKLNTGAFEVNKKTSENSRLAYDFEGKTGYNIVRSQIDEVGNVDIQAYFTLIKGETVNLTLLAEDCAYLVNFYSAKFVLVAFDQPMTCATYMVSLATLPRFKSNTVALAQSLDCSRVGENHIYRVANYNGDNYNNGTDALDIDLQSGAYTCTITNTEPTTNQNRVWYCMTLKGTATLKGRWYGI